MRGYGTGDLDPPGDIDRFDCVALLDREYDIHSFDYFSKDCVTGYLGIFAVFWLAVDVRIEVRCGGEGDEELRSVGVQPGVGHRDDPCGVVFHVWMEFVVEAIGGLAFGVDAGLDHESVYDSVPFRAVVKVGADEPQGSWIDVYPGDVVQQLDDETAFVGADSCVVGNERYRCRHDFGCCAEWQIDI